MAGHVITRLVGPRGAGELIYDAQARDGSDVSIVVSGVPRGQRDERARFRRGARIRAAADHPGLLPVRGYGEHAGAPFLVTDPYPRETLADLLDGEPIPADETLPMLASAAEALDLCHGLGLTHQNLSDESLLLDGDRLVLDGFGLTTASPNRIWGSVAIGDHYATPEEMRGEPLESAGNVYSLAAVLVHVLTGSPPYEGEQVTLTYAHLAEPPPRPSEGAPQLGHAIDGVIAWGMDKEPSRRPPSAAALLQAAADALGVAMPASRAGVVVVPRRAAARARDGDGRPGASRRRWLTPAAVSAVAVICAAAAGGFVTGSIAKPFGGEPATAPERRSDARLIGRLDERRGQLRAQLADARLPQQQSMAAAELASSYRDAARTARSPAIGAVAHAASSAYGELAGAAEAGSAARFADASEAVRRAEERLAAVTARSANLQDERK
ncbi:MAG TPA: protein kinase [Thermoleophilaceae bacterium]|nr:protein kinase [Thermoleophilaceae bacterium]